MARDILSPINITYDENGNVVPVRCNYIAESVAGTGPRPSPQLRPKSADASDAHSVEPGVNPGPEDWEKYYTGGSSVANNAVSDLDDIMTKIQAYFGEDVEEEDIRPLAELVYEVAQDLECRLATELYEENQALKVALAFEDSARHLSESQRETFRIIVESSHLTVDQAQDPEVLRRLLPAQFR